jgi:hypothetical protein
MREGHVADNIRSPFGKRCFSGFSSYWTQLVVDINRRVAGVLVMAPSHVYEAIHCNSFAAPTRVAAWVNLRRVLRMAEITRSVLYVGNSSPW